jgi:hypothetical protein
MSTYKKRVSIALVLEPMVPFADEHVKAECICRHSLRPTGRQVPDSSSAEVS